jgi:hypothetical protein
MMGPDPAQDPVLGRAAVAVLTDPHPCADVVYAYTDEALVGQKGHSRIDPRAPLSFHERRRRGRIARRRNHVFPTAEG